MLRPLALIDQGLGWWMPRHYAYLELELVTNGFVSGVDPLLYQWRLIERWKYELRRVPYRLENQNRV
jgi:hypothetical protein